MAIVGDATIRLGFDGKSLEASMDKTEGQFTKRSSLMGKLGGEGMSAAWGAGIGAIAGLTTKVVDAALDIITTGIDGAIKRVDTMNNFPRVMENLGIPADKSAKVIDDLGKRLKGLPTTLDSAALAVQRFTSSNGDVEKSEEYFLALNNALLAGGASADIQSTALEQLSQSYAKGKPDMIEWRSFMTAAPAQAKQLASALGYANTDALGEALRKGELSMDQFMSKMVELNKNGSGDFKSLEDQAKAATGGIQTSQANLQSAITRGWAKILNAIGSDKLTDVLSSVGSALENVLGAIAGVIDFIVNNEVAFAAFKALLITIGIAMMAIVVPAFVAWAAALLANPITWIILAVVALITGIILLVTHIKEVGEWFNSVFEGIGNIINDIGQKIDSFIKGFVAGFQMGIQNIKDWFASIPAFFANIIGKIGEKVRQFGAKIGEVVSGAFKAVVNGVLGFIENFINTPVRAINGLIDVINAVPGIELGRLDEFHLPRLAKGGVTTGSTFANIGEAGAEAVIPLERNTDTWAGPLARAIADQFSEQGIGGASGITVYMTNNINNNLDADEIGQRLMTSIRRAA